MTQILVVDDSPIERRRVGRLLEKGLPGVSVTYATDGKVALESLSVSVPDLIVTDLRMPNINGLGLVESITSGGYGVPVILMTGFGNEEIAFQALSAGAASYVPKGVLENQLIRTIEGVLSLSQAQQNRHRVLGTLTDVESRFQLQNDVSLVQPLIAYLQEQIATMRLFDHQQLTRIGVALHESLINAIDHGNLELDSEWRQTDTGLYHKIAGERRHQAPYASRRVRMVATMSSSSVQFVIADQGPGFDPTSTRDPLDELNRDRIGGRGLLLIRSFMDQVSHNSSGNEITLTKSVHRNNEAHTESPPH